MRVWLAVLLVVLSLGCGAAQDVASPGALSRYGIHADLPMGWHGRIGRGALHAANFPLPRETSTWLLTASMRLGANEALVLLFERDHGPGDSPPEPPGPELSGQLQLTEGDFGDGVVDDGHGHARRLFSVSGRDFVLFVETGARSPSADVLEQTNELLASLRVDAGDFYRGRIEPARFSERPGWDIGTSGARDVRADGDWLTSWAATVEYRDEWNSMARTTLESLPRDGIVIWVGIERNNRYPLDGPPLEEAFDLADFEHRASWEGQVRDLPEYVLSRIVRNEYRVDVRVYFGRPDPTDAMRAEAQAMLDGLELPEWGPWELDAATGR